MISFQFYEKTRDLLQRNKQNESLELEIICMDVISPLEHWPPISSLTQSGMVVNHRQMGGSNGKTRVVGVDYANPKNHLKRRPCLQMFMSFICYKYLFSQNNKLYGD